jgi:hypothetical protein
LRLACSVEWLFQRATVFGFLKQTVCHNLGNHNGTLNCDGSLLPVKVLDLPAADGPLWGRTAANWLVSRCASQQPAFIAIDCQGHLQSAMKAGRIRLRVLTSAAGLAWQTQVRAIPPCTAAGSRA